MIDHPPSRAPLLTQGQRDALIRLALAKANIANACGHWDSGGNAVRHAACRHKPLTECVFRNTQEGVH